MGTAHGKQKRADAKAMKAFKPTLKALGITESEGAMLQRVFNEIDGDGSGQIDLREFMEYLDVERTPFSLRAFGLFDEDGSGEIDLGEYLISLYNYCTHSKQSLCSFAFDLYDTDGSGNIDLDEVEGLLREVWGDSYATSYQAQGLMQKVERMAEAGGGQVSRDQFQAFCLKNLALLFPAFQLQLAMQTKIGGVKFWEKMLQRRYNMFEHQSNLAEFLDAIKAAGAIAGGAQHDAQLAPGAAYAVPPTTDLPRPGRRRSVAAPVRGSMEAPTRIPVKERILDVARLDFSRQGAPRRSGPGLVAADGTPLRPRSRSRSPVAPSPVMHAGGRHRSGSLPPLRPATADGGSADADPLIRAAKRGKRRSTPGGREPGATRISPPKSRQRGRGERSGSTEPPRSRDRQPRRRSAEPRPARGEGGRRAKRRSEPGRPPRRNRRAST